MLRYPQLISSWGYCMARGRKESLVGQRFGKQVVLRELGDDYVEIRCDCGTVKKSRKQYIKNGQSKSCGCGRYDARPDTPPIVVGQKFHYLTVTQLLGTNGHKREVLCVCYCGVRKVFEEGNLRRGDTKSCGCFRKERMASLTLSHGQGGKKRTKLYRAWESMRRRVKDPVRYPSYVGRTVAPEWDSFEAFRDYIEQNLGPCPEGHSLDRKDNEKGYEPGNIRWASYQVQVRNRRSTLFLTARGEKKSLAEWSEIAGIDSFTIRARMLKGWTHEEAIFTPVKPRKKKL
jgi:hypothetical protein